MTQRTPCFGCGNMTATMADGRCDICGTPKLSVLQQQPIKHWGFGRALWLAGFAFLVVLVMLLIDWLTRG
jgi:hypothetical protein